MFQKKLEGESILWGWGLGWGSIVVCQYESKLIINKEFKAYRKALQRQKGGQQRPEPLGRRNSAGWKHFEYRPNGGRVFPLITTIFKLIRHIYKTNVLTKFHDDWPENVTFRESDPPGGHVT
ncbi:hypothetical protein DPMN_110861 [Dreissena polymorpha]|uniref:Uncharacterized protein n=1 Tax=Dreissena polymorpha TaxID=45954 RepID=A0A9D4KD69_DREPO|nr:hypothetical protein DPMN_110861 [Dreissena polymorpha]